MSIYEPQSGSDFGQRLVGNTEYFGQATKQVPRLRTELVKEARLPGPLLIQNRPNHVIINNSGSYAFLYTTTGSVGGTSNYDRAETAKLEVWVTGSYRIHDSAATATSHLPIKLDINPVAWRQTDGTLNGTIGDITFVFNQRSIQRKA